ncbi:hypothetical protein NFI96_010501 [Prochilodus magdalenae]|nr:hypothetical protein NFI96_010501 [Prochilodus magdalenae]
MWRLCCLLIAIRTARLPHDKKGLGSVPGLDIQGLISEWVSSHRLETCSQMGSVFGSSAADKDEAPVVGSIHYSRTLSAGVEECSARRGATHAHASAQRRVVPEVDATVPVDHQALAAGPRLVPLCDEGAQRNGPETEPLPLMDLCRRAARLALGRERLQQIETLPLPQSLKNYLQYQ